MTKRTTLILISFLFALASLQAQRTITGNVTDSISGQAVDAAHIMLLCEDGRRVLSFSFSLRDGSFSIEVPAENAQAALVLAVSHIAYNRHKQEISGKTEHVYVLLHESTTSLREVRISAPPIRQTGDTLNFYISNFVRPQDRNLADVLARMPGIEVRSDGRIEYGGLPINRFYIENLNLLGQRYSLATQNLSPSDISVVQVFENHEPVNMLRDRSTSEQAAINVQLREDVRARWIRTLDFGVGGFPFLYDANGTLARFARGNQTLIVAKANNTGRDIFQELTMHTLQAGRVFQLGATDGIPDQFTPLLVTTAPFTRDRARFNESAITSINQLWRVAEHTDLRLNINYGFEREQRERNIETEFHFENQPSISIRDHTAQTIRWHRLENQLTYTANNPSFHLEQKLTANMHWREALAAITANNYHIEQQMKLPRLQLKNNTTFSRLLGEVTMGITNNTAFTRLPQSLVISSPDNLPLFLENRVEQSVLFNDGVSDTQLSFSYRRRFHTFRLQSGVENLWQTIESELNPLPAVAGNFQNSLSWNTTRLYAEPSHQLNFRRWTSLASASVNWMHTNYSGTREDYFFINPRLRITYEASANLRLNAGYSHTIRFGNLNQMQTGYVLKRYNHFARGVEELQRNATHMLSWGILYRNISRFLNINYLGSFSQSKNNLVPANFIQDIYNFTWWEFRERPSSFWMNMLSASSLFPDISLTTRLSLSYNQTRSTIEQQGAVINHANHTIGISPSLRWNKNPRLNFDYTMNNMFSGVSINNKPVETFIPLISNQLAAHFIASDRLSFNANLQHFYNNPPNASASNLLFVDLGMRYAFERVTLHLDWTNILNQREHSTSSFSTINTITRVDKLRPSEILLSFRFRLS